MFKKPTIQEKWHQQAEQYKLQASKLPPGRKRDELFRKARQLETASLMNNWLSSPELRPPD